MNPAATARLEKHEKRWRERPWKHFYMTSRGRMSWANWFVMRVLGKETVIKSIAAAIRSAKP